MRMWISPLVSIVASGALLCVSPAFAADSEGSIRALQALGTKGKLTVQHIIGAVAAVESLDQKVNVLSKLESSLHVVNGKTWNLLSQAKEADRGKILSTLRRNRDVIISWEESQKIFRAQGKDESRTALLRAGLFANVEVTSDKADGIRMAMKQPDEAFEKALRPVYRAEKAKHSGQKPTVVKKK